MSTTNRNLEFFDDFLLKTTGSALLQNLQPCNLELLASIFEALEANQHVWYDTLFAIHTSLNFTLENNGFVTLIQLRIRILSVNLPLLYSLYRSWVHWVNWPTFQWLVQFIYSSVSVIDRNVLNTSKCT